MRKPGSSSRAKLKSCGRAKTVLVCSPGCFDVLSTTRICQGIHDRACCLNSHTVPSWEAKRRAASQARVKEPCGSKQPKAIQDYSKRPTTLVDPAAPDLLLCLSQIPPIWGANRARSALPLGGDVLLRSSQIPPIWGAKRVRSAFIRPNWRDWANLGDGPAGLIAERLLVHDVADYVGFRAACRRWRHFSLDPHAYGVLDPRFHPRQWIMLKGTGASPHHRRCFLNLSSGDSRFLDLPELRGHDVYGPTTEGLLVLVDTATFVVRLLNPFTRQAAKLPPATTLLNSQRDINRARVSLSVVGAGLADHGTIAVHFYNIRTLAVVKPGDPHWTVVDRGTQLLPAMSFAGRFYCATTEAVMVVETGTDQVPRLTIAAYLSRPFSRIMRDTVHLVDNDGKLMLVDRECRGNNNRKYKVYGVDLDARKMVPANGFGGRAVFIGRELAHSVSPLVFPSISADAIYLGFQSVMTGRLDHSPIHLMAGTSHPRQFDENMPIYGPLGIDDYLSWCVTGYGDIGG